MSTMLHNGSQEPFHPTRKPPTTFGMTSFALEGELAVRAARAATKAGMSARAFTRACIEYALDHMEAE